MLPRSDVSTAHVSEGFVGVLQSKARSERLESTNAYQGAELMNLQREVYHLRSLLSSHGIDPTLVCLVYILHFCLELAVIESPQPTSAIVLFICKVTMILQQAEHKHHAAVTRAGCCSIAHDCAGSAGSPHLVLSLFAQIFLYDETNARHLLYSVTSHVSGHFCDESLCHMRVAPYAVTLHTNNIMPYACCATWWLCCHLRHSRKLQLGVTAVQAPRSAVSPWSLAATPEHLWDTTTPEHLRDTASITPSSIMSPLFSRRPASRALQSPLAGSLGLSAAAPSPYTTHPAAAIAFSPSTSSSGQRPVFTSATPASSLSTLTGKADVSAGRRSSSSKQSQVAAPHSATFSGSPVAGLCRTRPQILVRMTKKQKVRQQLEILRVSKHGLY